MEGLRSFASYSPFPALPCPALPFPALPCPALPCPALFFPLLQDIHSRLRTESYGDVTGRFNERFLLSLAACPVACVVDDELNILPLSSHIRHLTPIGLPPVSG